MAVSRDARIPAMVASVSECRGSVDAEEAAVWERLGGGGTGFRRTGRASSEDDLSNTGAERFRFGSSGGGDAIDRPPSGELGFSGEGCSGDGLDEADTNVSFDDVDAHESVRGCPVGTLSLLRAVVGLLPKSWTDGLGFTTGGGGFFCELPDASPGDSAEDTNIREALLG